MTKSYTIPTQGKHDAVEELSEAQMERLIRFFDYLISDEILADIGGEEQPNDQA